MNRRVRYDSLGGGRSSKRRWPKMLLLLILLLGVITVGLQSCNSERVEPTEHYEPLVIPGKK
ncbi:hypothetical protein [Magnetococcus sp. PR-3]|uniref:hypothetical protein n=1 Tax=Magnetococcus sp. PR-3 TaxID=3120355 RepID=UPI002FCE4C86